jgi:hypothetical protein
VEGGSHLCAEQPDDRGVAAGLEVTTLARAEHLAKLVVADDRNRDRGTEGGAIRAIGFVAISASPSSQRNNCCTHRYRVAAVDGDQRANWSSMNASTCSRRTFATTVGMPRSARSSATRRAASRYALIVFEARSRARSDRPKLSMRSVRSPTVTADRRHGGCFSA